MHADLRGLVLSGVEYVQHRQLISGEVSTFATGSGPFYCPCPLLSALVHDTLGYLDPSCPHHEDVIFDGLPAVERRWLISQVIGMRWRMRTFLAWQEESDGTWQFHGRDGATGPDPATTACAAAILLPAIPQPGRSMDRHVKTVTRLLDRELDSFERAHALRFLALAGQDVTSFAGTLKMNGEPLPVLYAIVRAWRQAALPGLAELAADLIPKLTALRQTDGGFGNELNNALAALILLDSGAPASLLRELKDVLSAAFGDWENVQYSVKGVGSPSLTAAMACVALARIGVRIPG